MAADLGVLEPGAQEERGGVQRPARSDDGLLAPHDELVGGGGGAVVVLKFSVFEKGGLEGGEGFECMYIPPKPHHNSHPNHTHRHTPKLFYLHGGDDPDGLPRLRPQHLVHVRAGDEAQFLGRLRVLEEGGEGGLLGCGGGGGGWL